MPKFEYTYLTANHNPDVMDKHIEMLNAWAEKGWELVSAVYPIDEKSHGKNCLVFFLKREISNSNQQEQ